MSVRGRRPIAGLATRSLLAGLLLLAGTVAPAPARQVADPSPYEQLQTLSSVLNHIRINYVDSVPYGRLVDAAIEGVLRELDPHSRYVSRTEIDRMDALQRGELATTGVSLEQVARRIVVLSVRADGPAERAGVEPGDRITRIGGLPVDGLGAHQVELRLAGPDGSDVRVTLERGPRLDPDSFHVTLRRRRLDPRSIPEAGMLDSLTAYVRLREFGEDATRELHDRLSDLRKRGARRLVLDLRGDPGGLVSSAVGVASEFLPKGALVFRTRGRKHEMDRDYVTHDAGGFRDWPLVLLIDDGTASAAEALAGCLQDQDRALILGRRSFGKALVQSVFYLPSGGQVWLTVGRVLTPSGRYIQRRWSGLSVEQYRDLAGTEGDPHDTLALFHTADGRPVRGGGGIAPDVELPAPPTLPVWWSRASDDGSAVAVADSVAESLPEGRKARRDWRDSPGRWRSALLVPLLARLSARFGDVVHPDSAVAVRLARRLAVRAATVRWGTDAGLELRLATDPLVLAARRAFARLPAALAAPEAGNSRSSRPSASPRPAGEARPALGRAPTSWSPRRE